MTTFDVIVVGGGVMGCATAYHLARLGRRVVLLEQYSIPNDRGSSHGPSRIIRLAYGQREYVALAREAFNIWRDVERESEAAMLTVTGGLDFAGGPEGTASLDAARAAMRSEGVPFDDLDADELSRRFPQFRLPNQVSAVYQADAGVLHADRCVLGLAQLARRHGAEVREHEQVLDLRVDGETVSVRTACGLYEAGRVVVTAGSWVNNLIAPLGLTLSLTVSQEQVAYFEPRHPSMFCPLQFPIFIEHRGGSQLCSGFPDFGDGVKVMIEHKVAGELNGQVDSGRLAELVSYAGARLPDLGEVTAVQTCRYTLTPDEDFALGPHPDVPEVLLASPCSGHGFKFAVVLGRALADLAVGDEPRHDLSLFHPGRPALRAPLPSGSPQ